MSIAPLSRALTVALVRAGTAPQLVLVLEADDKGFAGLPWVELGIGDITDPIDTAPHADHPAVQRVAQERRRWRQYSYDSVLTPAGHGERHIASGTNFPEHAKETSLNSVFHFPKFGAATPSRTRVAVGAAQLLDYEVEICVRFDRPLASAADFEAAAKGFFLCGDFTDRAALMRKIKLRDIASGIGFSDAKSAVDYFPTGPFLVIPRDWRTFVRAERIATEVNGQRRQDAHGAEMTLDFAQLAERAISQRQQPRYVYRGQPVALFEGDRIERGVVLMSGTPDGVIFRPPGGGDITQGVWHYATRGLWRGESFGASITKPFVEQLLAAKSFLQPGDRVRHFSSSMGDVMIEVVAGQP